MNLQELSVQYRSTADQLEQRWRELKEQQKTALGEESILLENRVTALYAELLDLRRTAVYLSTYHEEGSLWLPN